MIDNILIQRFDECLKKHCSYIYNYYQPPLPEDEIVGYMNAMGIQNDDYKVLYNWKNGLDLGMPDKLPQEFNISFFGNFISIQDAALFFEENRTSGTELDWPASQAVIMDNLMGERLLLETDSTSPYNGFVFRYAPFGSYACESISYYDSLEKMLLTIIELFEQKALWFDESSGCLEIDFDKQEAIGKAMNPKSKYWELT